MNRFAIWVVVASLVALVPTGYVLNVIKLARAESITGLVILRAVGVPLVPLGAVLGLL